MFWWTPTQDKRSVFHVEPEFQQHHPLVFQIENSIAIEKNEIKQ